MKKNKQTKLFVLYFQKQFQAFSNKISCTSQNSKLVNLTEKRNGKNLLSWQGLPIQPLSFLFKYFYSLGILQRSQNCENWITGNSHKIEQLIFAE